MKSSSSLPSRDPLYAYVVSSHQHYCLNMNLTQLGMHAVGITYEAAEYLGYVVSAFILESSRAGDSLRMPYLP